MTIWDWVVIAFFLAVSIALGVALSRRGSKSTADFFLSGRDLPWWLAGTSILATSFSCDTPLHVTKVIRELGLSGAWFYWAPILFVPMVTFLFSRLWRRAQVMTDCEFVELRYVGRVAAVQRLCWALFRFSVMGAITMGWVLLGMSKIARAMLDLPPTVSLVGLEVESNILVVLVLLATAVIYTSMAGLWGVVANDFIQFVVAMGGSVFLAIVAVRHVGGLEGMKEGLDQVFGPDALSFLPGTRGGLGVGNFIVYCAFLGWCHAEADGGGNKAQRFLASRSEGHALAGSIWDIMVQNIIRNWPWYITALASLVIYPTLSDHEMAYPRLIVDLLPSGLKGLMIGALFMAFLSTASTHLNLCASYAVNDIYKRFLVRNQDESHYMAASRWAVIGFGALVAVIALSMESVLEALKLKAELMSGLGLVVVLRWYWYRINPWSELAAMATSIVTTLLVRFANLGVGPVASLLGVDPARDDLFPVRLLIVVVVTALVMLTVTLLTRPADPETLRRFYLRVRPRGPGFRPIARDLGLTPEPLWPELLNWALASLFVISAMLAVGHLLLAFYWQGLVLGAVATTVGFVLLRRLTRPVTA